MANQSHLIQRLAALFEAPLTFTCSGLASGVAPRRLPSQPLM